MINPSKPPPFYFIPYSDGDLDPPYLHELYEYKVQPNDTAVLEQPITYHWIHIEVNFPQGD